VGKVQSYQLLKQVVHIITTGLHRVSLSNRDSTEMMRDEVTVFFDNIWIILMMLCDVNTNIYISFTLIRSLNIQLSISTVICIILT
jgi:hypothetical protein